MKLSATLVAALVSVGSLALLHPASAMTMMTPTAKEFVQKATIANMFEIDSSKLALQKSQNDDVKKFAQHMVDDHTKAGDALKAALPAAKIDASVVPSKLDSKHQSVEDKLDKASAADFDKDYIKAQVDAHNEAVSLFSKYAKNGKNATLKDFASTTLPTLQEHKTEVDALKDGKKPDGAPAMGSTMAPAADTMAPSTNASSDMAPAQ